MEVAQACAIMQKMAICRVRVSASPRFAYRRYIQQIGRENSRFLANPPYHHIVPPNGAPPVSITERRR